jgi:hypothetical protein
VSKIIKKKFKKKKIESEFEFEIENLKKNIVFEKSNILKKFEPIALLNYF